MGNPIVIELDEEIEGDEVGSRNYCFAKIGEPLPITTSGGFDLGHLPSRPLAVSQRFRLLFVAHPHGFHVTRTKDILTSAEEFKEKQAASPYVHDFSLVDISLEKISILALSADDSLLAACVPTHVHFFAVSALLHKETKPSYSVCLDESVHIKDFCWARKFAKDYIILATGGKLYHGSGQGPISYVMEDVDAVDWSVKGNFLAVAKNNRVSILSSQFKEKSSFLLQFSSVTGDSDVNQVIKVDSIQWIRSDCIAVGCFQINEDGEEENYIVQLITNKGKRITDVSESSKPTVLSFNNAFLDFSSEAVPVKDEPHMFLSYLDHCGLAFLANRNLSQRVGLLCWALDSGQSEVAIVEILNDAWNLYIDSQDNGEENVIVGISVDKVSQNENATLTLGDEETEVSPCCIIICLTIDGKISVFHFASAASALVSSKACVSDEDDSEELTKLELHLTSSAVDEESREPTFTASNSRELGGTKTVEAVSETSVTKRLSQSFQDDVGSISESTGWRDPQTLQASEQKKNLPVVLSDGSNEEYKPVSDGKNGIASFLGKAGGDISHQSIKKYPISSSNMEPLGKVPPRSSESVWSLPNSNARIDGPKTSDESFITSNIVDHSNKPASQYAGGVLRNSTDLKEKEKPSFSFSSFGQTSSSGQVNRNSTPVYPGSQVPGESAVSGKSSQPEYKKGLKVASSTAGLSFPQSSSKQFGNVVEMAKKLDSLLEDIEGEGGFVDASITAQTQRVPGLEENIWALSNRCRIRKGLVDKQLREVELLFDKMIQVFIRKVYMEGIFKQAKDSRYWELWNRQKLSSELDLKRRRILQLNQELVNKLIELERHFNSLEFNKFGEVGGMQNNRRVLQNWQGPSRKIQSLHSLHSTIQAQLTAAEQLSGCLSQQMAALSIESTGKQELKKQLFEYVGLPYVGDSPRSLARDGTFRTPPKTEHSVTSGPDTAKEQSNRNHATFVKSDEPETARRRRESLDHSWASFDPPKTTVKRILKEDYGKGSAGQSLSYNDKQYYGSQVQNKYNVDHSAHQNLSGALVSHTKTKGTIEIPTEQSARNSSTSVYQKTADLVNHGLQLSSLKPPQPLLESSSSENRELGGAIRVIAEKSKSSLAFTGQTDSSAIASKLVPKSDASFHSLPSISKQLPERLLSPPSGSIANVDFFKSGFTMSTTWDQKNSSAASEAPSFDSKSPITPASAVSSGLNVPQRGLFTISAEKPDKTNNGLSSSTLQSVGPSLLSSNNLPSVSSFASASPVIPSSGASVAARSEATQPLAAVPSTLNFLSALTSSTHVSSLSPASLSSGVIKSESLTSHSHPSLVTSDSKNHDDSDIQTSAVDVTSNTGKDDDKVQAPQPGHSFSGLAEVSDVKSGRQIDASSSLKISSIVTSDAKLKLPQTTEEAVSSIAQSPEVIVGGVKSVTPDVSNEEEMEESPDAQQMTEFAFGNLGGFGIGTTPNSTTPKSNPFGVVVKQDSSIAAPPLLPASGGELFRPASFNFQAPQPLEPLQPAVSFSGGFNSGNPGQVSGSAVFGQPAQIGGQQALGSMLGTFGQSRQLGGLSGNNFASVSGFGSRTMGVSAGGAFGGGFTSASTGGGFAGLASNAGGFAAAAGGGFASAATAGGGFAAAAAAAAGGGFAAAATAGGFAAVAGGGGGFGSASTAGTIAGGGGFGAFGSQQGQVGGIGGGGGFSAFGGGGTGGTGRPQSQLFTQMRK